MLKVILENSVDESIDNFIDKYLNVSLNMYIDCGIYDLHLIEENYYITAIQLRDKIYIDISLKMSSNIIGKHTSDSGKNYTVVTVGNFRLFVYYSEEGYTRFIEDIEFFRK